MPSLCVFCGSKRPLAPNYLESARELGRLLGERRYGLVYGGASVGVMGVVADASLAAGGEVIGVLPEVLVQAEVAHRNLTRLELVGSMHERKARMVALSDAFLALPGGFGTLDELFEVLTWAQLGIHSRPIGLLNTGGYFDHLLRFLESAEREGFVSAPDLRRLRVFEAPVQALEMLFAGSG